MTRFILFFTFIKIFLSCPSFAATGETGTPTEEPANPTHTVLKHTFTTLNRWRALPETLKKPLTEKFPGSFSELDALNAFEQVTRGILEENFSLTRKEFARRTKETLQTRYSIESHDEFVFPIIARSINKKKLLKYVWKALKSTPYGGIIIQEVDNGTLKKSIVFYGLFSVSHEEYSLNEKISGFMIIKNFFLAGAVDSLLAIRPGFMTWAIERGLVQQQLLIRPGSSGASTCTSLTDIRSARTGSLTTADLDEGFVGRGSGSPDSHCAQAGGGVGSPPPPATFGSQSPKGLHTPTSQRKREGGSDLTKPLLEGGEPSSSYTAPSHPPANKKGCCAIL